MRTNDLFQKHNQTVGSGVEFISAAQKFPRKFYAQRPQNAPAFLLSLTFPPFPPAASQTPPPIHSACRALPPYAFFDGVGIGPAIPYPRKPIFINCPRHYGAEMAGKSNKGRNRGKGSNAANSAEPATESAVAPGSLNEKSGAVESSKVEANGVEKSDAAIEASEPADAKPEAADAASAAFGNRTKQADVKPKFRWILPLCFVALVSTGVCYYAVPGLRRWV